MNENLPEVNGMRYKLLDDSVLRKYKQNIIQDGRQEFIDIPFREIRALHLMETMAQLSSNLSTPSRMLAAGRAVDRVFYEMDEASCGNNV